jgi:hypothetical protein
VPPPPVLPEVVQQQDPSGGPDSSMSGIWWNDSAMTAMIQWPWLVMMFMIIMPTRCFVGSISSQCDQQPWDVCQVDCLWSRRADLFGFSGTVS